jgi:hypothetical protein
MLLGHGNLLRGKLNRRYGFKLLSDEWDNCFNFGDSELLTRTVTVKGTVAIKDNVNFQQIQKA